MPGQSGFFAHRYCGDSSVGLFINNSRYKHFPLRYDNSLTSCQATDENTFIYSLEALTTSRSDIVSVFNPDTQTPLSPPDHEVALLQRSFKSLPLPEELEDILQASELERTLRETLNISVSIKADEAHLTSLLESARSDISATDFSTERPDPKDEIMRACWADYQLLVLREESLDEVLAFKLSLPNRRLTQMQRLE